MKRLYVLRFAVVAVCAVGTAALLVVTPDVVPAHYNFAGEADRFGSKYENLIFPLFALIMGTLFLLLAKGQRKKGEATNETILLCTGVSTLIFFTALGFFLMAKAIGYDPAAAPVMGINAVKFVSVAMGALLMTLGNTMPKMRRNALFGLRTKWSMANDGVWQKSQRFSGVASVICGLLLVIAAIFVPGVWNIVLMTALILAWIAASVAASYRYYRADSAAQHASSKENKPGG